MGGTYEADCEGIGCELAYEGGGTYEPFGPETEADTRGMYEADCGGIGSGLAYDGGCTYEPVS
jgi:hypothetical protein